MILTKAEYLDKINLLLADNSTQEISPLDLRTSLVDLVDSIGNIFIGSELDSTNFSSPDTRTTRGGDLSLNGMFLAGRSSVDNSAFGYASLRNNFNGVENTAVGSFALACNLYGSHNSALGYLAVGGNTSGSGNVGIGSFALNNGKYGNFNIGIGHGAGYYVDRNDEFKFYLGAHPIASGDTCVDGEPVTSGDAPLLFGDLKVESHRLGIGVNTLHDFGMLQVSGDVTPRVSGDFNLGNSNYPWSSINNEVHFSGSYIGFGGAPSGDVHGISDANSTMYGDLLPSEDGRWALGNPGTGGSNRLLWDGYFNDVIISGQALINNAEYNTVQECLYECKTLHLATSGFCDPESDGFDDSAVCGILNDEGLDGAGFEIHSSGAGNSYRRDYRFIYRAPDVGLSCLPEANAFTRSRFESNISLELIDNTAFIGERLLGRYDTSLAIQSGCMGIFLEPYAASGQRVVVAQEPQYLDKYPTLDDVNFISRSGTDIIEGNPSGYDYSVMYGTVDSGVQVAQRFASRIKSTSTVRGFSIVYHDELDQE